MVIVHGLIKEKIKDNHALIAFYDIRSCELYSTLESVAFLVFPSPESSKFCIPVRCNQ